MVNEALNLTGKFEKEEFLKGCKELISEARKRISRGSHNHPDLPCLVYHMGAGETDKSILEIVGREVWVLKDEIVRENRSAKRKTGEFLFDFHDVARMCKKNFFEDSRFQNEVLYHLENWEDCVVKLNKNNPYDGSDN